MKVWLVAAVLGCSPDSGPECSGGLQLNIDMAMLPSKTRIAYGSIPATASQIVWDDCLNHRETWVFQSKAAVVIQDFWLLGVSPLAYSLLVEDLGTCAGTARTVLRIVDAAVPPGDIDLLGCSFTKLTLPEALPADAEVNTCGQAFPGGKACTGTPSTCEVSHWEHECNCSCIDGFWSCVAETIGTQCAEPRV